MQGGKSRNFSCILESIVAWHGLGIRSYQCNWCLDILDDNTEAVDVAALMFFEVQSLMFLWCSRLPWSLLELRSWKRLPRRHCEGSVEPCVKWTCAAVWRECHCGLASQFGNSTSSRIKVISHRYASRRILLQGLV